MKKKLVYFIAVLIALMQTSACSFAKIDSATSIAIKKYKKGNYTGCLQDCQNIVRKNPKNAFAYYYLGMAYTQAGKKKEAVDAYTKVLSLKPSTELLDYAQTGKKCLEDPTQCKMLTGSTPDNMNDIDKFISSPNYQSTTVRQDLMQKHLNSIKNEINSDKELDDYEFRKINRAETNEKIAQAETKKPSEKDIEAALKTLNDAGINPYQNPLMMPTANQASGSQNSEMTQINMLMGANNRSNSNDEMMNMLPYMMSQNKDGANNYSPQALQAIIMNSMMTDFNYDLDKNN